MLETERTDPTAACYAETDLVEHEAAQKYANEVVALVDTSASVLALTPPGHPLAGCLTARGCTVDSASPASVPAGPAAAYDAIAIVSQLEGTATSPELLTRAHALLRPDGVLLVATPSLDSWTIQAALLRANFRKVSIRSDLQRRRGIRLRLPASRMLIIARAARPKSQTKLSVIMPVYNESRTFAQALDAVLAKSLPGLSKEVIVVESNSTDGTRDLVLHYRDHPDVKVLLQDEPRGKGNAVRHGLQAVTGDIVLIQDADLEYDVNDYDSLLEPLLTYQSAFVLGSRHTRSWKIRVFNDQPLIAAFFNFGHAVFLGIFNLLYGQRLSDPFTMFKVFRADCIHGLHLECNQFDFDFELVIKLIRKGYCPLEVPINYRARSFSEGKKVSVTRDPLTWLRALAKYRVATIWDQEVGRR